MSDTKIGKHNPVCTADDESAGSLDAAMNLAMLQIVANSFKASRDAFDSKDKKRGYSSSSYEASLGPIEQDIETLLVKAQFLTPRRQLSLPALSTPPSTPSRWRKIINPISPSKTLLRPFKSFKKKSTLVDSVNLNETDDLSDTETIKASSIVEAKLKAPLPCPPPPVIDYELSRPFPFRRVRNLKTAMEPRRSVHWGDSTVWSEPTFPSKPSSETWAETLNKPIAELTYSDIASTSPRLIQRRFGEESRTKKGIAVAATLAAKKARVKNGELAPTKCAVSLDAYIFITCVGYSFFFFLDVACALSGFVDMLEKSFKRNPAARQR